MGGLGAHHCENCFFHNAKTNQSVCPTMLVMTPDFKGQHHVVVSFGDLSKVLMFLQCCTGCLEATLLVNPTDCMNQLSTGCSSMCQLSVMWHDPCIWEQNRLQWSDSTTMHKIETWIRDSPKQLNLNLDGSKDKTFFWSGSLVEMDTVILWQWRPQVLCSVAAEMTCHMEPFSWLLNMLTSCHGPSVVSGTMSVETTGGVCTVGTWVQILHKQCLATMVNYSSVNFFVLPTGGHKDSHNARTIIIMTIRYIRKDFTSLSLLSLSLTLPMLGFAYVPPYETVRDR